MVKELEQQHRERFKEECDETIFCLQELIESLKKKNGKLDEIRELLRNQLSS